MVILKRINLNILECKLYCGNIVNLAFNSINLNILECKD